MAYSTGGRCPRTHPVALGPETERRAVQASGRCGTLADFVNGCDQETLERLVEPLNRPLH